MVTASRLVCALVLACVLVAPALAVECPDRCSGKGDCDVETGRCRCADGWTGLDCSHVDPVCGFLLRNCSGHGVCRSRQCHCHKGWAGTDCSRLSTQCPNNCLGHGQCKNGRCQCEAGYVGEDCSVVVAVASCPSNCSGHGACVNGRCECFPGFWTGAACDHKQPACAESLRNCSGHGLCGPLSLSPTPLSCSCLPGYCGDTCEELCGSCARNCSGHGVCVGTQCHCDVGFRGADCSTATGIDGCPYNCSGHGRCVRGEGSMHCQCDPGFHTASCALATNTSVCPDHCSGKGECFPDGCHCYDGFAGDACDQVLPTCESANHCSGHGKCVGGVCECFPGFRGFDCTTACHEDGVGKLGCFKDLERGLCVNGTCVCKPEWTGEWCEDDGLSDLWEEYRKGYHPLGSSLMLAQVATAGALAIGVLGLVAYKAKQALGKKKEERRGGLLDKGEVMGKPAEFES